MIKFELNIKSYFGSCHVPYRSFPENNWLKVEERFEAPYFKIALHGFFMDLDRMSITDSCSNEAARKDSKIRKRQ